MEIKKKYAFLSIRLKTFDQDPSSGNVASMWVTPVKHTHPPQRTEPVATVTSETGADITMSWWHEPALPVGTKLYTTPPQRTWVGLTDEDVSEIVRGTHNTGSFVRAITAKLKEKNT